MTAYLFRAMLKDKRRAGADTWQEYFEAGGITEADAEKTMRAWMERNRPRVEIIGVEAAGVRDGGSIDQGTGRA